MNITLSAEEKLIERARARAQAQGQTLNELIRQFMVRLTGEREGEELARQFEELARQRAGRSKAGFVFNRDEAHERGGRR